MPIELTEVKTKSGFPVLRANFVDPVTVEEATAYHQQLGPGATYHHHGHLAVGNVNGVSAEVRKVLGSQKPDPRNPPPVAVVLSSAIVRLVASAVMRISENANSDSFKTEAEALAWLDQRMVDFTAKLGAR